MTALALAVANIAKPLVRQVSSDFELGTLFMYLFFVCIGAGANLAEVIDAALPILAFIVVMVLVHFILLVAAGRLFRLDLAEVMIASNACILGPATAAALAAGKGWQPLVAPGDPGRHVRLRDRDFHRRRDGGMVRNLVIENGRTKHG